MFSGPHSQHTIDTSASRAVTRDVQPGVPEQAGWPRPRLLLVMRGVVRIEAERNHAVVDRDRAVWVPEDVTYVVESPHGAELCAIGFWRGVEPGNALRAFTTSPLLDEMAKQACEWGERPPKGEVGEAFYVALAGLVSRWAAEADDITLPMAESEPVQRGLTWLLGRLGHPVGPVDAAKQADLSLRTFQRRCRQELGMSPSTWLQRARVLRGLELLDDPTLDIDTIALRCGYQSQASFGRVFKEHLGLTPVAWRNRHPSTPAS